MCGIAGILASEKEQLNDNVEAMMAVQCHRGPDQDPHFSEVSPFNLMGGQALYLLERQ